MNIKMSGKNRNFAAQERVVGAAKRERPGQEYEPRPYRVHVE